MDDLYGEKPEVDQKLSGLAAELKKMQEENLKLKLELEMAAELQLLKEENQKLKQKLESHTDVAITHSQQNEANYECHDADENIYSPGNVGRLMSTTDTESNDSLPVAKNKRLSDDLDVKYMQISIEKPESALNQPGLSTSENEYHVPFDHLKKTGAPPACVKNQAVAHEYEQPYALRNGGNQGVNEYEQPYINEYEQPYIQLEELNQGVTNEYEQPYILRDDVYQDAIVDKPLEFRPKDGFKVTTAKTPKPKSFSAPGTPSLFSPTTLNTNFDRRKISNCDPNKRSRVNQLTANKKSSSMTNLASVPTTYADIFDENSEEAAAATGKAANTITPSPPASPPCLFKKANAVTRDIKDKKKSVGDKGTLKKRNNSPAKSQLSRPRSLTDISSDKQEDTSTSRRDKMKKKMWTLRKIRSELKEDNHNDSAEVARGSFDSAAFFDGSPPLPTPTAAAANLNHFNSSLHGNFQLRGTKLGNQIKIHPSYHRDVMREDAVKLLERASEGTYLIRPAKLGAGFCLCYKEMEPKIPNNVKQLLILEHESRVLLATASWTFECFDQLIYHYSKIDIAISSALLPNSADQSSSHASERTTRAVFDGLPTPTPTPTITPSPTSTSMPTTQTQTQTISPTTSSASLLSATHPTGQPDFILTTWNSSNSGNFHLKGTELGNRIESHPAYHQNITKEEATEMLEAGEKGCYLIRSAKEGVGFSLCYFQHKLIARHQLILEHESRLLLNGASLTFPTIDELIDHYKRNNIKLTTPILPKTQTPI